MQIRHRRFAINDEDRQLTYLNIYDAPHELSDSALVRRLEPYCEVIHMRRGRYPTNRSFFNGNRHYRVRRHAAIPSYLRFGKFIVRLSHDAQEHTCRKCNRLGHFANDCPNTFCFNCEELGNKADSCPSLELCCICKHHCHRARYCPYSWHRRPSPPDLPLSQPPPPQSENQGPAHDKSQQDLEQTSLAVQLPATTDVPPTPTDVPPLLLRILRPQHLLLNLLLNLLPNLLPNLMLPKSLTPRVYWSCDICLVMMMMTWKV